MNAKQKVLRLLDNLREEVETKMTDNDNVVFYLEDNILIFADLFKKNDGTILFETSGLTKDSMEEDIIEELEGLDEWFEEEFSDTDKIVKNLRKCLKKGGIIYECDLREFLITKKENNKEKN